MAIFRKKPTELPRRRQSGGDVVRRPAASDNSQTMFQRNRTLTGSTSNHINAANHPSDLQSPRTHVHHLAHVRRRIGIVLLAVLGGATVLLWLLTQFTAQIVVSVSDATLSRPVEVSLYQKAINDYLGINPFSRLRFALDEASLGSYLSQTLPEVAGLKKASFDGIGSTDFTIIIRKPVAGWMINSKQYFVDAKGVAFERNYYPNPSVQIVDDSGASLQQGATVASNRFLGFVGKVVALSDGQGYTITQAILPAGTTRQLEVKIKDVAPSVRLSIDRPAGEQVEDMSRALKYFTQKSQAPQYIDVRVSGKAFYK